MSEGLISTVRERYGRAVSYRGLFTLAYKERVQQKAAENDESRKRGLLRFLLPRLQSVSQHIHDEVNKLLERREKLILQSVSKDMPQIIGKNTAQLRMESLRFEKTQADKTSRLEKRVELINADTGAKLKAIQKELLRHKADEAKRTREQERIQNERQIKTKYIRQRESRDAEREREELWREMNIDITRAERRITKKLRDDEEYEKRRRG